MPELLETLIFLTRDIHFVRWQETPFEVLLILSSCSVDCATRPEFSGPCVIATNESVDHCLVSEDELPAKILEAVQKYLSE